MDAFSIAVSIGLQYGVPLETYVSKFTNLRFEPSGMTDDPDVRMAQSLMDYVFRRLALDYLSFEDRSMLGIYSAEERQRHLETGSYEPLEETGCADELMQIARVEPPKVKDTLFGPEPVQDDFFGDKGARTASGDPRRAPVRRKATPRRLSLSKPLGSTRASKPRTPTAPRTARSPPRSSEGGPHLRRAPGEDHRHRGRQPPLHDLRHQDAPRRQLLRLRRLRQHLRLQLSQHHTGTAGPPPSRRAGGLVS